MHRTLHTLVPLALPFALALSAPAQDESLPERFARLDADLRIELADDGRILLWPDPAAGGAAAPPTGLVAPDFSDVFQNGGFPAWLAMAYQGDTDLASMGDAEALLRRLGRDDDQSLLQAIGDEAPRHAVLLRLYAIRVAQARGLKPALGPLERALERGIADPHVARAAREARATLRGETLNEPAPDLQPLAEVLAGMGADPDFVACAEAWRLPPNRRMLPWGRRAGLAVTMSAIQAAGGSISLASWAGAVKLTDGVAVAPYELARRFGNHRVARLVCAGRAPVDGQADPQVWVHADGVFDVEGLRGGLRETGFEVTGDGDRVEASLDGMRLVATPSVLRLGTAPEPVELAAAAVTAQVVARDDAPYVVWIREGAVPPDVPPELLRLGVPRRLALWIPRSTDGSLRVRIDAGGERLAGFLAAQAAGVGRLLEAQLETAPDGVLAAFEPVLDVLDDVDVAREDQTVTATVRLGGLDLEALVRDLIRATTQR